MWKKKEKKEKKKSSKPNKNTKQGWVLTKIAAQMQRMAN